MRKLNYWHLILPFVLFLTACQSRAPLGEPFDIPPSRQNEGRAVRIARTDLVIDSCFLGEDFTEEGSDLWVGLSGSLDGEDFEKEVYSDSTRIGAYEIEIFSADFRGGCTLQVTEISE